MILKLTEANSKPQVEIIPAHPPIMSAPKGSTIKSAHAPMATPPAKVAFWMCS